jgi:hypothetical protein
MSLIGSRNRVSNTVPARVLSGSWPQAGNWPLRSNAERSRRTRPVAAPVMMGAVKPSRPARRSSGTPSAWQVVARCSCGCAGRSRWSAAPATAKLRAHRPVLPRRSRRDNAPVVALRIMRHVGRVAKGEDVAHQEVGKYLKRHQLRTPRGARIVWTYRYESS